MNRQSFIIFNDVHLKSGNESQIMDSLVHMIDYADEHGISKAVLAGDLFDSRSFQRLMVLITFNNALDYAKSKGIEIIGIPGNHDKAKYHEYESFLEPFKNHPAFTYYSDVTYIPLCGFKVCLLPFFEESMLIEKIVAAQPADLLISHFEMNGSTHLGKVVENSNISKRLLSKFGRVFLGHYHDKNDVADNIHHLPSLRQNNFGENDNKGFTVVNSDGSHTVINGVFRRFKREVIDLDKTTSKEVDKLLEAHKNSDYNIRFVFTGEENKLKSIKTAKFKEAGIDVEIKYKLIDDDIVGAPSDVKPVEKHTEQSIVELFESFCNKNNLDGKRGKELLYKFLKTK